MDEDCFSRDFCTLWRRLCTLEKWYELAVRPNSQDCHIDDLDLLSNKVDDCAELSRRLDEVRSLLNRKHLLYKGGSHEDDIVPATSSIPGAGLGLFYQPASPDAKRIESGATICYYQGYIHNFHSAKQLEDRNYLMLVQGDLLVDPQPLLHVKARYINDPLNPEYLNCVFVPYKFYSAVVATRKIEPGEELFVSYGDAYWSQHDTPGRSIAKN